jgi:hypothetical protein
MSFEQIKIGRWLIEVDREATQAAYLNEQPISACGCCYCENYVAACCAQQAHSPATLGLFQSLGITPEKEAEVYALNANPERTHTYYGGFYHLVGRIIEPSDEPEGYTMIDDQFEVTFTEQNDLLSAQFPRPALQMEFLGFIPWVLDEGHIPDDLDV